ncbi:MAG: alkylhydroperoxidase-related (seleno)protein [Gammaproteobacteria bacterium]
MLSRYANLPVRIELAEAIDRAWDRLASPGVWWTASERLSMVDEIRSAPACPYCAKLSGALSPFSVPGSHARSSDLPDAAVEVIHRVRNDSGRLSESWFRTVVDGDIDEAPYIEIVGVLATTVALDTFSRALGLPLAEPPPPRSGSPSQQRPTNARRQVAWVATIAPHDRVAGEFDPYSGKPSEVAVHIHQALSLVPQEAAGFFDLDEALYLPQAAIRQFDRDYRAISHPQMELIAARLSAINQCTY